MSDFLKHECGIAVVRLLKPLQYYEQKYGTPLYGFNKLFLLMEKQHNRGQDGAGIGCCKLGMAPGQPYMFRERSTDANALVKTFNRQAKLYDRLVKAGEVVPEFTQTVKEHFDFGAEILIGHLRYGTSGNYTKSSCHPYFRRSNWPTKNLMVLGNFNMTNSAELNRKLMERGQHPIFDTDTQTVLEELGYHLDQQHDGIYRDERDRGTPGMEIPDIISSRLDVAEMVRRAGRVWDGGYAIAGIVGSGQTFVLRDPHGIRPAYVYRNEEVVAFTSERVPLMTVFEVSDPEAVQEVPAGCVSIVEANGRYREERFADERPRVSCSFERIYFSRGNDPGIYQERKALGAALAPKVMDAIGHDLDHAVFSYIPNTAEIAYHGLLDGLRQIRRQQVRDELVAALQAGSLDEDAIDRLILNGWPRAEKIAHKDIKMRTFISQEKGRNQLVSHVYDVTYGVVGPEDSLVCIDDSIVRGTTLRRSILKMLSRTRPRRILIASTAPQIRYPDCYGIDMSELGKFIAFQAAVSLLREQGRGELLMEVYQLCLGQADLPSAEMVNHVALIYDSFTPEQISTKISELVYPAGVDWKGEVEIIYLGIRELREALPDHRGDWYFTGNYPTPGGYAVLNQAYINYFEDRSGRSYDIPHALRA